MMTHLILDNIRSAHNVGSIMRTADGFGVMDVHCCGYTPYPVLLDDTRLPHIARKLTAQIEKTALGAHTYLNIEHHETTEDCIVDLKKNNITIIGLEQDPKSVLLDELEVFSGLTALVVGEEVHGLTEAVRQMCDLLVEIPMHGKKESFNVSVAAGIALYRLSKT